MKMNAKPAAAKAAEAAANDAEAAEPLKGDKDSHRIPVSTEEKAANMPPKSGSPNGNAHTRKIAH